MNALLIFMKTAVLYVILVLKMQFVCPIKVFLL